MQAILKILCPVAGVALIAFTSYGIAESEQATDQIDILIMGAVVGVVLQVALLAVPRALDSGQRTRVVVLLGMVPGFAIVGTSSFKFCLAVQAGQPFHWVWPLVVLPSTSVYGLAVAVLLARLRFDSE